MIILKTDDGERTYTFRRQGDGLAFVASESSEVRMLIDNMYRIIPDGTIYTVDDSLSDVE